MKRLNRIARKITAYDEAAEKFFKECEDSGMFSDYQITEIYEGVESDLTIEQIKVYANPKFKYTQMAVIREGFEEGLTMDQVKIYANPKFNWSEMREIKGALEKGMSIDKVKEEYNI